MPAVYADHTQGRTERSRAKRKQGAKSKPAAKRERVQVKVRGGGRSLMIDGTFASYYAPGSALTHSVWDALVAPLLLLPRSRRKSVLILGLGGGSAARLVRLVAPRARIVGVELDPEVVAAGRRWFDLDGLGVEVVTGDAEVFLRRSRARFDAVIEDIFVGRGRAVHKPAWLPTPGLRLAAERLTPGGVLVSNTLDEAPQVAAELRRRLPHQLHIDVDEYDNRVIVGSSAEITGRSLRAAVAADPTLRETLGRLSFRSR